MNSPFYIPKPARNHRGIRWWIRLGLIPAILVVVASVHMFQWANSNRSSWGTGCGFGMFATVDYHGTRFVKCWREVAGEWQSCPVGEQFEQVELVARIHPTDGNLRRLASVLFEAAIGNDVEATESPRFRVEVWGMNLDGGKRKLSSHLLNRVTIKQATQPESYHVAKN